MSKGQQFICPFCEDQGVVTVEDEHDRKRTARCEHCRGESPLHAIIRQAQDESETWRRALTKVVRERDELQRRLAALMTCQQAMSNLVAEWAKLDKEREGQR